MLQLTQKDLLELKYWFTADMGAERCALERYRAVLGLPARIAGNVLEIGTGPAFGLLPMIEARTRTGVDPLYPVFESAGILADRGDIWRVDEPFEYWDTNNTYDLIVTTNALDHGAMGFYLLPKMARLLKPGGTLAVHVHLRPVELLNLIHDHALTVEQLDRHLGYTDLIETRREIYEHDVDGKFCSALVGVWRKPE